MTTEESALVDVFLQAKDRFHAEHRETGYYGAPVPPAVVSRFDVVNHMQGVSATVCGPMVVLFGKT